MSKATIAPEHTITREVDVKRRKVTTWIAFPASEHLDRYGATAGFGLEVTTEYRTGGWLADKQYESKVRGVEITVDGTVHHFSLPLHDNEIPSGGYGHIDVDGYSRVQLEEVADAFVGFIASAPGLVALEKWAIRHNDHLAQYGIR